MNEVRAKSRLLWLLLGLACSTTASADTVAAHTWRKTRQDDGIASWTRDAGDQTLPAYRARVNVQSSGWFMLAILDDIEHACEWTRHCLEMRRVRLLEDDAFLVYAHMNAPWPVHDRDVLTRVHVSYPRRGEVLVKINTAVDGAVPLRSGIVRMPTMNGHYRFRAREPGETEVEYEIQVDAGGSLPDWLKTFVSRNFAHDTLDALRTRVKWAEERRLYRLRAQALEKLARGRGYLSPFDDVALTVGGLRAAQD